MKRNPKVHQLASQTDAKALPQYEPDDGLLTKTQIRKITKCVPQGTKRSVSSSLFVDAGLTLKQRLDKFDPARHGGEVMVTDENVGAENHVVRRSRFFKK